MVTAISERQSATWCPDFVLLLIANSLSSSGPVIWTKMDKSIQLSEPLDTSASKWFISRAYWTTDP